MPCFAGKLVLIAPLAICAVTRAQFQAPTQEELKMTADPKAPGAAAVYLNVEQIANDELHYQSFYARIKVLTEKGKELATVELPFVQGFRQITNIKGRTIHADGTVVPLTVKPEDLEVSKSGGYQVHQKVFTLPSVEVGSILEYQFDVRYDDGSYTTPRWEVQRDYFVHKAHYVFTPFKGFMKGQQNMTSHILVDEKGNQQSLLWWKLLPPGEDVKMDASGHRSLEMTDIPARPDEEWMPPVESILYKVVFYYRAAYNAGDFWESAVKQWAKEVDHFAEASKSIRDAVAGIVAPADSDLEKAKKLYKAVQALDNTDFSRKKGKAEMKVLRIHTAKRAEDTWAQKNGSGDDIALLYLAMLRAAGITAYAMRVVDRDQGMFAPAYLDFDQLDSNIVIASVGGKEIFLDPGEKMCTFQELHWKHTGAGGVRESADGRTAGTTPLEPYTLNSTYRGADVSVDEHGAIKVDLNFVMKGQEALRWRQEALTNDLTEVKKRFDEWLKPMFPASVEAHVDHFLSLDDPNVNLVAIVRATGSIGSVTSKRLLLPGFFFETQSGHPFVDQAERLEPVDMHYGEKTSDDVTYHLPAGFTVEGVPKDGKIPWEGHAVLAAKTEIDGADVTVTRNLERAFTFAKAEDYKELVDFYRKVAEADQQQLVLTTAPQAKGN
jgi:hypothetical protein